MEVLEASPSKPSVSSVVLMMISRETSDTWTIIIIIKKKMLPHINPRRRTAEIQLTTQVTFHAAHFVPCRVEVDGEGEPAWPLFTASPRGSSGGGRCPLTLRTVFNPAGVRVLNPAVFLPVTVLRLSKIAGLFFFLYCVRWVTCSNPIATLPWRLLVSSAAPTT